MEKENSNKNRLLKRMLIAAPVMIVAIVLFIVSGLLLSKDKENYFDNLDKITIQEDAKYYGSLDTVVQNYANEFILVRNRPIDVSFYGYTEGITDDIIGEGYGSGNYKPSGAEGRFYPGSQLVKITLDEFGGATTEDLILDSVNGYIRDPDVSPEGNKLVFSWKTSTLEDEYHLYTMDIDTRGGVSIFSEPVQITFGMGISDIEPKFLANGKIVFNSTRAVQTVDCWKTPVSNLFTCNVDGSAIIRLGYDQVHTTYPTVTPDGRVIYTRWDYNDRTQMYVQALFQMNQDGTNQTELYGNNINWPTNLLHTVAVPSSNSKYLSIVSGHHVVQGGKLAWVDLGKGRNSKDAIKFVKDPAEEGESIDALGQIGKIYKYPIAINEFEMFYARALSWAGNKSNTKFDIIYYNANTDIETVIVKSSPGQVSPSQFIPIRKRAVFNRPSTVNYGESTGVYYIGNIYEGEAVKGVEVGEAKYLRVVALDYRPYSIGSVRSGGYEGSFGTADPHTPVGSSNTAWDIKQVLGIIPIESDGSVMFRVPADLPVYFQILDEDGLMIQSMRSWTTLMPGETFSCVGCHEDKNTAPPLNSTTTLAMRKGVQLLQKDLWMTTDDYKDYDPYTDYKGFSYLKEIQPILDNSCVGCHDNTELAYKQIGGQSSNYGKVKFEANSDFKYTETSQIGLSWAGQSFSDTSWTTGKGAFGTDNSPTTTLNFTQLYLRKAFSLTADEIKSDINILWQYDEDPILYLNGVKIEEQVGYVSNQRVISLTETQKQALIIGQNTLAISVKNAVGGCYISVSMSIKDSSSTGARPVSLASDKVQGNREAMAYSLSYLVLTGSVETDKNNNSFYYGNPANDYINWIGAMSDPNILPPRTNGSSKSNLITKILKNNNHSSVEISKADIMRIAAWIDLCAPFKGTYDEANTWNANQMREAEERDNMREFYSMVDKKNKQSLAKGINSQTIEIEYYNKDEELIDFVKSKGIVQLNRNDYYKTGDKILVKLPRGEKYLYFNLDAKIKGSVIYCPDGVFEYEIPTYADSIFPITITKGRGTFKGYKNPTITALIPSEEELYSKTVNLGLNPYADYEGANTFPKANASSVYFTSEAHYIASNAINGYRNNGRYNIDGRNDAHGAYPLNSWGPARNQENLSFTIDFGRNISLEYLDYYLRYDVAGNHDTYMTGVTLEFSDGSTQVFTNLQDTKNGQRLQLEKSVTTKSVILKDFVLFKKAVVNDNCNWFSLTEVEAYGKNIK